jgi:intracellular multiplication protein IcmV
MARKRPGKGFFRSMVDFPTWMNLNGLRESGSGIMNSFENLQKVNSPSRRETFEEAVVRLGLDDNAIARRMRQCYLYSWIYVACVGVLLLYAFYLFIFAYVAGGCVALLLSVMAGVFAYREAFWYLQMSKRKLGCTFAELVAFITGRE